MVEGVPWHKYFTDRGSSELFPIDHNKIKFFRMKVVLFFRKGNNYDHLTYHDNPLSYLWNHSLGFQSYKNDLENEITQTYTTEVVYSHFY